MEKVLIAGEWREAHASGGFRAEDPKTGQAIGPEYPVSRWEDCDLALNAATEAFKEMRGIELEKIAAFLEQYAANLEVNADALVAMAASETALPASPRLSQVELPRTTGQLRQAAAAAREGSWQNVVIDTKNNIRTHFAPIGPVVVFGPNNFPFAFNGIAGGDFAAAIAAGNPVIAKAHPSHPGTSRLLAEQALAAVKQTGLPAATVQMIYALANEDGLRLVSDPRTAATGFTGSSAGGLRLKAAADAVGKPIYLEMSSINPVVVLPAALQERGETIARELATSCLMGSGQFCTSPNMILLTQSPEAESFVATMTSAFEAAPSQPLLSRGGLEHLSKCVDELVGAGAKVVTGGKREPGAAFCYDNTILRVSGADWLEAPETLEKEAFGNATMVVMAKNVDEAQQIVEHMEGNLTGALYSANSGADDADYDRMAPALRARVGRLLNDKAPTGVAVSPAMNHGGPYPSTGHPGFTSVGIPVAIHRFAKLDCYDNVRAHRLPKALQDKNPNGTMWRSIDGSWSRGDVAGS